MLRWLLRRVHPRSYRGPNRTTRRQMAAVSKRSVRGRVEHPGKKEDWEL